MCRSRSGARAAPGERSGETTASSPGGGTQCAHRTGSAAWSTVESGAASSGVRTARRTRLPADGADHPAHSVAAATGSDRSSFATGDVAGHGIDRCRTPAVAATSTRGWACSSTGCRRRSTPSVSRAAACCRASRREPRRLKLPMVETDHDLDVIATGSTPPGVHAQHVASTVSRHSRSPELTKPSTRGTQRGRRAPTPTRRRAGVGRTSRGGQLGGLPGVVLGGGCRRWRPPRRCRRRPWPSSCWAASAAPIDGGLPGRFERVRRACPRRRSRVGCWIAGGDDERLHETRRPSGCPLAAGGWCPVPGSRTSPATSPIGVGAVSPCRSPVLERASRDMRLRRRSTMRPGLTR